MALCLTAGLAEGVVTARLTEYRVTSGANRLLPLRFVVIHSYINDCDS